MSACDLVGVPLLVVGHPHADHAGVHVGVVAAAQLGALAGEDDLLLTLGDRVRRDLEPGLVRVARDRVELAAELRDPPGVDDVVGGDVQQHGHADRHDHVGVDEQVVLAGVAVAPHVLLAVDGDLHLRALDRLEVGRGDLDVVGHRDRLAVLVDRPTASGP